MGLLKPNPWRGTIPKPIVCLSEALRQYLEIFRPCFSQPQRKYFVTDLLGLVECEERKTLSGLLRWVVEHISLSGLSRFLGAGQIYKVNGVDTSFTEMMGLPAAQLDTTYWLPWYNNTGLDTQLRIGVP